MENNFGISYNIKLIKWQLSKCMKIKYLLYIEQAKFTTLILGLSLTPTSHVDTIGII